VRILVVDSDEDTRALYRQVFQLAGCDVVEAADGRDALTKALVRPPALIVTDIRLAFVDGYALCDILRRDHATAAVPILVVTADARSAASDRARGAGADAVLVKPTRPERLLAEMQRLLGDSRDRDRSVSTLARASSQTVRSAHARVRLSKSFARFMTTEPPSSPPDLVCPMCDQPLTYEHSYVGGVNAKNAEQWDMYVCSASCGTFQYRHRTRKLGRTA